MAHGSAIWGFPAPTCSPAAATTTAPSSTSSSNPWRKLCRSSWVLQKRLQVEQRLRRDLSNIVLMRKGRLVRRPFRIVPPELCSDALAAQRRKNSVRCVRRPMKANPRRIEDCIADCRDGTVDANLGHRFGTPWPSWLVGVDENDLGRRHVAARQNLVVEERGIGHVAVGSKWYSSVNANPMPFAIAPMICPRTRSGLIETPQSTAATYLRTSTFPVSSSTSISTKCAAKGGGEYGDTNDCVVAI